MLSIQEKLLILSKLAKEFNKQKLLWAVGSSLLLYFKGYVDTFHDIDLMVADADSEKMEAILHSYGELQPSTRGNFATKHFREFVIEGVEVDMIGGFAIVKDGTVYDCDLKASEITGFADAYGQQIPLHSVALWRKYYAMIGREQKVAIIEQNEPELACEEL